jgi:signal transduction histidine kinase
MAVSPNKIRSTTIATRLLILVLATTLPLLGFAGYLIYSHDAQNRESNELAALDVAHSVASATAEFMHGSKALTQQLVRRTSMRPDGGLACDAALGDFNDILPAFVNVVAIGGDGIVACTARPSAGEAFRRYHDDPWFKTAMGEPDHALSAPFVAQTNGRWISVYTAGIDGPGGRRAGVMALGIDLAAFSPVMRVSTSRGAVAGLIDERGTIVGRSVDPEKWIGQAFPVSVERVLSTGSSQSFRARGADGVERLHAFVQVPGERWIAFAALLPTPRGAEDTRTLRALCLAAILITAAAGAAALLLGRRIARSVRSMAVVARAAADGDRTMRAAVGGPREVREVALEFNHMIDVRDRSELELRELAQRFRGLSQRMIEVEATERRHINRELHDRVGQNLAVLNIGLHVMDESLGADSPDALKKRVRDAQALLQTTIVQVRDVMSDLRPAALDDYGLFAALRTYVEAFAARTGLPVTLKGEDISPRLPLATETAFFRIAQEALVNAAKHAAPAGIEVVLASTSEAVTLSVCDDGTGFEAARSRERPSWGLNTMSERADSVGASLRIDSRMKGGTRVVVELKRQSA